VLWLLVGTGIGIVAAGERLFPDLLKFSFSVPVGAGISVDVSRSSVDPAFVDAVVFGWLTNAAFAAICFVTPRLTGTRLMNDWIGMLGLAAWNIAVAGGIALLAIKGASGTASLAEFPLPIKALGLLGLLSMNAVFWRTVLVRRALGYVSLLYFGIGLLASLGLVALGTIPNLVSLGATNDQLLWAFCARGLATYWVLGAAIGTLYYVIPRATRNPLYSNGLALLGWAGWLAFAGLSAVGALVDPTVPYPITSLGQAGTLLLLAPTFLAVANLLATVRGRWSLLLSAGTIPFAVTALAFLAGTALLESVGALRSVQKLTDGTDWALGVELLAWLGAGTFAFFAFADHALPRALRRGWSNGLLTQAQLWTTFLGVALAGVAMILGGLAHGSLLAQGGTQDQLNGTLLPFRLAALGGIALAALGAAIMLVSLFLLYTSGQPADYAVPETGPTAASGGSAGQATAAAGQ
jgi:cbb3-type cytochrome oxidase subunit 1